MTLSHILYSSSFDSIVHVSASALTHRQAVFPYLASRCVGRALKSMQVNKFTCDKLRRSRLHVEALFPHT